MTTSHEAGRHLAVAEALLRGHSAKLHGPSSLVDIDGQRAQVQIKGDNDWVVADVDKYVGASIAVNILVDVAHDRRDFYLCPGPELREVVSQAHQEFLERHGGTRPRNPDSKNVTIKVSQVAQWKDNWSLLRS